VPRDDSVRLLAVALDLTEAETTEFVRVARLAAPPGIPICWTRSRPAWATPWAPLSRPGARSSRR
jgi:hypothetical protein